jgi:hypothetical protein
MIVLLVSNFIDPRLPALFPTLLFPAETPDTGPSIESSHVQLKSNKASEGSD